jgi:ribonucleoside-diphosphate reductase alpha chain
MEHLPFLLQVPRWDTSRLRAKGTRLKTFGGRASGPEPLEALFLFAVSMFQHARGRKLTPLECHDLVCKVAEIVVVGGVRR